MDEPLRCAYASWVSRLTRWTAVAILATTAVMEVVAYLVYRDATDGVFVNIAVAVYGLLTLLALWATDRLVRRVRRRNAQRPT